MPTQASEGHIRRHSLIDLPRETPTLMQRRFTVAQDTINQQRGHLEVHVTLQDIENFEPTFKTFNKDECYSYSQLSKAGMPPSQFIGPAFTPLPDIPDPNGGARVLAVQGTFIPGGVIVSIYLHHSVCGVQGLTALMRCMSISEEVLPSLAPMTMNALRQEAWQQSSVRDRLSGSRGTQANMYDHPVYNPIVPSADGTLAVRPKTGCKVLAFSLEKLDFTRDFANDHFLHIDENPTIRLSRFQCLIGILWKALTRARWPQGVAKDGQTSALVIPIDIRTRMETVLDLAFYGNSDMFAYATSTVSQLGLPFDVSTIGRTSDLVRTSFVGLTEAKIRSAIAIINEREDVRSVNRPCVDFESDVFMTNWADVPVGGESTLGLGLGPAEWTRKLSREPAGYDCVLLPLGSETAWEVVVQLPDPDMMRLLEDPGLKPFLLRVS